MKIQELSIKNCLSFCEKGLNDKNHVQLGDFNLFVGSNNAGKSNVLKLIKLIDLILLSIRQSGNAELASFPLNLENLLTPFGDWFFAQNTRAKLDISFSLKIEQMDQPALSIASIDRENNNPVLFMLNLKQDWPKLIKIFAYIEMGPGNHPFATITKVEIPNDHRAYNKEPTLFDRAKKQVLALRPDMPDNRQVWKIIKTNDQNKWIEDFRLVGKATYEFLCNIYDQVFKDILLNIPAIREIKPGQDIIRNLASLRDRRPNERQLFFRVRDFMKQLIFNHDTQGIDFVFPPEKTSNQVGIEIAVEGLQLPLSHYGAGVEQMLYLAAEIVRKGANKVILIEEPEAHFHPELQRKFIKFLRDNQDVFKHQYLIATHSNIFIDEFLGMRQNVFYVYTGDDKTIKTNYSQVELLNRTPEKLPALLSDLGAKPSDILMANGVLVVEGVTDKDVYTDWARKIGKPFEEIALEVIDVEGAGNISKYLSSTVIQRSCFRRYALCDKNAESDIRNKLKGIVPEENTIALKKGDLEDYYPRELVLQFAKYWAEKKNSLDKVPSAIEEGRTVEILNRLLGEDWWKRKLAEQIIKEMKPDEIHVEVKQEISKIHDSLA